MKYYIRVQVIDYSEKVITTSDANLNENIGNQAILEAAELAAIRMVGNNLDLRIEQRKVNCHV